VQSINGTFRFENCSRINLKGGGFLDLTCEHCNTIKMQINFCLRVLREQVAKEQRGTQNTDKGRRLGYLTSFEIRQNAQNFSKTIKGAQR
jgi:hypothetical protein